MLQLTPAWLQSIESLKNVPAAQLQWLIDNSRHFESEEGDFLFHKGDPVTGTYFIITGRVLLFIQQNKGMHELSQLVAKDITGYLPFSRGLTALASGKVEQPAQIMMFPVEKMKELINSHFELTQALVHIMTSRVRDFTTLQQQNEKMMALGKLSAGLAHELNNPASAIVRGSTSLKKHLQLTPDTFKKVISIKMSDGEIDAVNNKMFEVLARKEKPPLTLMQRTTLEDNIAECLEGHEVENSQELAENFIEFGFSCDDMDEFSDLVPPAHLSPVLNWINNNLVTEKMVNDILDASQRISNLVNSVKNFTQMDRDHDKEYTDIHSGLRNTLTMLGHRLKKGNIQLVENYDASIPPVKAYVGELNQVWTNLIDNALDALEIKGKGRLEISTKHSGDIVQVFVTDDGPGIEPEIKSRIFDPFFTTKEIGKGTGLGLDVVSRIVRQHRGSIEVESGDGKTTFAVCFPVNG
jgi:signal transduction histidine kinase